MVLGALIAKPLALSIATIEMRAMFLRSSRVRKSQSLVGASCTMSMATSGMYALMFVSRWALATTSARMLTVLSLVMLVRSIESSMWVMAVSAELVVVCGGVGARRWVGVREGAREHVDIFARRIGPCCRERRRGDRVRCRAVIVRCSTLVCAAKFGMCFIGLGPAHD